MTIRRARADQACAGWRGEVGAYLVGALNGDARARVIAHLEACAGCRGDYDELVPVRGLLSQLAGPDAAPRAGGPGKFWGQPPGGVPLPPLRPVRRKAGRRWLMGAMAAVAAEAVAVIAGVGLAACCWPSRCGHPARARSRVCRCDERRRLGNLDACGLPVPGVPGHR